MKDITGYEGIYAVCSDGRIWSYPKTNSAWGGRKHTGMFLQTSARRRNYRAVQLRKDGMSRLHRVHRLVAAHYVPNPQNKPFVNHKDGNKSNNHYQNLEWVSEKENTAHAIKLGLVRGNFSCKLTERQVKAIRKEYAAVETSYGNLADAYNTSVPNIHNIVYRKTWRTCA